MCQIMPLHEFKEQPPDRQAEILYENQVEIVNAVRHPPVNWRLAAIVCGALTAAVGAVHGTMRATAGEVREIRNAMQDNVAVAVSKLQFAHAVDRDRIDGEIVRLKETDAAAMQWRAEASGRFDRIDAAQLRADDKLDRILDGMRK